MDPKNALFHFRDGLVKSFRSYFGIAQIAHRSRTMFLLKFSVCVLRYDNSSMFCHGKVEM
jgi:hypothetical protein